MRFVILDTETTGMNKNRHNGGVEEGHRVVEVGCVEVIDDKIGKSFHRRVNPGMKIQAKASEIHGISDDDVSDKLPFKSISKSLLDFIAGATLVIHNAPFDIAFLDKELSLLPEEKKPVGMEFNIIDTLEITRQLFPFQDNTLDALAGRFNVKRKRIKHSALTDAKILAEIFVILRKMEVT